jgi:arylsulfatase A-like enzyme/multidrug efflux pump subunit AcrA (membrane-fusion protein)
LGALGNSRGLTPNLDRIASEGALFTQAFASDIPTQPSHTALFTGQYGVNTGIVSHFHPDALLEGDTFWLPTQMRKNGYATGAVDHLFAMKGWFKRGYHDYMPPLGRSRSPGSQINEIAFPWITQKADQDFFLFLHYWDAHIPYMPPSPFKERFTSESAGRIDPRVHDLLKSRPSYPLFKKNLYDFLGDIPNLGYIADLYDAEVAYLDFEIGRLFDHLGDEGLLDNTMVVLFGDHGENMTEHDSWFDHAGLYDSVVHVPLILWAPGRIPVIESGALVQLLDVLPTVGGVLEIAGTKDLDGRSLMPLMRGETTEHRDLVMLSESTWQASRAVRSTDWKLIKHLQPTIYGRDGIELYNLIDDPNEQKNVVGLHPEVADRMGTQLDEWFKTQLDGRPDPMLAVIESGLPAVTRLNDLIAIGSGQATGTEAASLEVRRGRDLVPVAGAANLAERAPSDQLVRPAPPGPEVTRRNRRRAALVGAVVIGAAAILGVAVNDLVLAGPLVTTGVIEPTSSAQLNMSETGRIATIPVSVGQTVRAGQVLATEDASATVTKLSADQSKLAADLATLTQQQQGTGNVQVPSLTAEVASAQTTLASAQTTLAQTSATTAASVAGALAQVQATQNVLNADSQNPPGGQRQVQVDQESLATAQSAYQQAVANRNSQIAAAQSGINQANAAVALALASLTVANSPGTPAQIATTEASIQQDQANIAADKSTISQSVVTAPFAGVVSSINGTVGEVATSSGVRLPTTPSSVSQPSSTGIQIFPQGPQNVQSTPPTEASLISLDSLPTKIVVQVPETSITQVHVGQQAKTTLPAYSGSSIEARVIEIEPVPVILSGETYFLVDLQANSSSRASVTHTPSDRMLGLTADVSF